MTISHLLLDACLLCQRFVRISAQPNSRRLLCLGLYASQWATEAACTAEKAGLARTEVKAEAGATGGAAEERSVSRRRGCSRLSEQGLTERLRRSSRWRRRIGEAERCRLVGLIVGATEQQTAARRRSRAAERKRRCRRRRSRCGRRAEAEAAGLGGTEQAGPGVAAEQAASRGGTRAGRGGPEAGARGGAKRGFRPEEPGTAGGVGWRGTSLAEREAGVGSGSRCGSKQTRAAGGGRRGAEQGLGGATEHGGSLRRGCCATKQRFLSCGAEKT